MKTSYLCDPNTTTSCCPFSLLKKGKTCANFLDANLIWVALNVGIQAGLPACIVVLWPKCVLSEVIKECVKKDARGGSFLADLSPGRRVVPCCQFVEVTPSKNKGHTPFSKLWV
jgi:hypothetical protein